MISADFLDVKSLKKKVTERKPKAPWLFSKASKFVLHEDHPWKYHLFQGPEHVVVDLQKGSKKNRIMEPICQDPIPKKYPDGESLKVTQEKLTDLQHFHDFLEHSGRNWIQEVVRKQTTAHDRPQECPEHETTSIENIQCDDQFRLDYASVPPPREEEENVQDIANEDIDSDAMGLDASDELFPDAN